jgi:hypothetical protein
LPVAVNDACVFSAVGTISVFGAILVEFTFEPSPPDETVGAFLAADTGKGAISPSFAGTTKATDGAVTTTTAP